MGAWWWQTALDQPALIHVLLSNSALHVASLALTTTVPTQVTDCASRHAIKYLNLTILFLQEMLCHESRKVLETAVLIICNLICVEVRI